MSILFMNILLVMFFLIVHFLIGDNSVCDHFIQE